MSSADVDVGRDALEEQLTLREYVEENREDLEALASEDYPISGVLQGLLDRFDRGDL